MSATQVTRRVYSAEELHRLRDTRSQARLREAIEEHDIEDAEIVKEHVLRGSKSFTARSLRSRNSSIRHGPFPRASNENLAVHGSETARYTSLLNVSAADRILGEIAPNYQGVRAAPPKFGPSPTPSIKRKKIEAIVKAHGSPTHVRVTAGGRVVPSVQSPLCYPRYGYSAIKTNGGLIKFAPNHQAGKPHWTQATENGYVAQDLQGNLCQIVNGTIMPLSEVDGALQLHMPAPNLNVTKRSTSQGCQQRVLPQENRIFAAEPPLSSQISALELEYSKLEQELKDVDRTEVLHGRTMGKGAKEALVGKRRELVVSMDKIRKGIKGLKGQTSVAPASYTQPNIAAQSPSPIRGTRLPYLQPRQQLPTGLPMYNPFWPGSQQQQIDRYGALPLPSPDEFSRAQPWQMFHNPMLVPPQSLDGSNGNMLPPFARNPYAGAPNTSAEQETSASIHYDAEPSSQKDMTQPCMDMRPRSSNRSHALPIRAPERKIAANIKSNLNPMSPVYMPNISSSRSPGPRSGDTSRAVQHRAPTPLSPSLQLQLLAARPEVKHPSEAARDPARPSAKRRSSSSSSFNTADFFPRDTREFSTRPAAYPISQDLSEDKENRDPEHEGRKSLDSPSTPEEIANHSNWNPHIPDNAFRSYSTRLGKTDTPNAPPGTPVDFDSEGRKGSASMKMSDMAWELKHPALDASALPDRSAHNVSPKNKRGWGPTPDTPLPPLPASPLVFNHEGPERSSIGAGMIDFVGKPHEWIAGYQAGLQQKAVGADSSVEFLDGYCSALLKTKTVCSGDPSPIVRPNSSPRLQKAQSSGLTLSERASGQTTLTDTSGPTLGHLASTPDAIKQVVFNPQNENAILTPTLTGPHVNDHRPNLGAWAKQHDLHTSAAPSLVKHEAPLSFTTRTDSCLGPADCSPDKSPTHPCLDSPPDNLEPMPSKCPDPASPTLSAKSNNTSGAPVAVPGERVSSLTSIDSALYRPWPGHRVVSPHLDWKSASSVAHTGGLASGYFANVQFDGALSGPRHGVASSPGMSHGPASSKEHPRSRFSEGSIDGLSNPPVSPVVAPASPHPLSPVMRTPTKRSGGGASGKKKESSPCKSPSPAKAKFEHIAEIVGIKAAAPSTSTAHKTLEAGDAGAHPPEPTSPQGKRRWRDVWRKQITKDDVA